MAVSRDRLAHAVRCDCALLDGEIACLGADGRSRFNHLLFRRDWPYFLAFDVLWLDGRDLRRLPLIERKAILKQICRGTATARAVERRRVQRSDRRGELGRMNATSDRVAAIFEVASGVRYGARRWLDSCRVRTGPCDG